jgi:hypothetical protein
MWKGWRESMTIDKQVQRLRNKVKVCHECKKAKKRYKKYNTQGCYAHMKELSDYEEGVK